MGERPRCITVSSWISQPLSHLPTSNDNHVQPASRTEQHNMRITTNWIVFLLAAFTVSVVAVGVEPAVAAEPFSLIDSIGTNTYFQGLLTTEVSNLDAKNVSFKMR